MFKYLELGVKDLKYYYINFIIIFSMLFSTSVVLLNGMLSFLYEIQYQTNITDEISFIVKYVFVYSFLLILALIISYTILQKNMLKKQDLNQCDDGINVVTRNFIPILVLILINFFVMNILNKFHIDTAFYIISLISLKYLFLFFIINFILVKNLEKNL